MDKKTDAFYLLDIYKQDHDEKSHKESCDVVMNHNRFLWKCSIDLFHLFERSVWNEIYFHKSCMIFEIDNRDGIFEKVQFHLDKFQNDGFRTERFFWKKSGVCTRKRTSSLFEEFNESSVLYEKWCIGSVIHPCIKSYSNSRHKDSDQNPRKRSAEERLFMPLFLKDF